MRSLSTFALLGLGLVSGIPTSHTGLRRELPTVRPNPNTERAGTLRSGVLTVALEAKESAWRLDGPNRPPMTIQAFGEIGRQPLVPGPLVRVPQGTEIRLSVRNALHTSLTFFVPASIHGEQTGSVMDSVVLAPGATGDLTTRAAVPGNYLYRATTPNRASQATSLAGLLAGAIIVDSVGAAKSNDRVFVIMETLDSASLVIADTTKGNPLAAPLRSVFTINGLSWPNTERIAATVGDSLHWRVLNASFDVHPMHLHGFYYRIDQFTGPFADFQGRPAPGQLAVTQLMTPFAGMSMTWAPYHPGNWIFHCHFAIHLMPDSISAAPDDPHMRAMVGLVLGINVAERPGVTVAGAPTATRHLRLVATADKPVADSTATMRFVLEEHGRRVETGTDFSPTIDLTRDEPVSISVVNHLAEPTSVHWHGIEVEESYVDGVPGVSGAGRRLAPAIAPGDSFEARFTPPRSGTFMYHAHVDEVQEQMAGLVGALIVRDPGTAASPEEHVLFLKGNVGSAVHPLGINGRANPDTIVMHVGRPARLRLFNLSTQNPVPTVWLTARHDSAATGRDTMVVRWRAIAKDGADLPAADRAPRPARQLVAMGETYDFEFTPEQPGTLRLEVRVTALPGAPRAGRLLVRVPIRVE